MSLFGLYEVRIKVTHNIIVCFLPAMDVKKIFTFKALDSLMDDHKKNSETFIQLYERKLKLL